MDETAYKQKYSEVAAKPCAFEKAILTRCVSCGHVKRIQIAEREIITCQDQVSVSRCIDLHDQLRHGFAFAQKRTRDDLPLTHAQEMRIQCGGLKGLQQIVDGATEVESVDALVESAIGRWQELEQIPYSEVVHAATQCYKGRHG
jgi:hypothetical protein